MLTAAHLKKHHQIFAPPPKQMTVDELCELHLSSNIMETIIFHKKKKYTDIQRN